MDQETKNALDAQAQKLEAIYQSVEQTRKYFKLTLIASIVLFVLPLVLMLFALPSAIDSLTSGYDIGE